MTAPPADIPRALAALDELRARCDQAFAQVAGRHPAEVACRPGCDDCCHAVFDLSPVESLALALAFSRLGRKERRAVGRRLQRAAADYDRVLEAGARLGGEARLEHFSRQRVACALLEGGRCALYAERPLTCRLYGVPVAAAGRARTCRKAGFVEGETYPTVDLGRVQAELQELSRPVVARFAELGRARLDVARALMLAGSPALAGLEGE